MVFLCVVYFVGLMLFRYLELSYTIKRIYAVLFIEMEY